MIVKIKICGNEIKKKEKLKVNFQLRVKWRKLEVYFLFKVKKAKVGSLLPIEGKNRESWKPTSNYR